MSAAESQSSSKALGVFSLVMITVVSVDAIRNLPTTALFGSSLIFFFCLAALFFLIPSALVSAELSSSWPKQGGVYIWVKEAFGPRWGFLAIWLQWIENVFWYPTLLSFVAGTIGFLVAPELAENKYFLIAVILVAFWGATFINLFGMRSSAWFSNLCAITGLLLPMALIMTLGGVWALGGHHLEVQFDKISLLPRLNDPQMWVALTGVMLSFCGIEIATVHARDVKNPQRAFPKALIIATLILLVTQIGGALSIAIVLPQDQISLVAGIMQAFHAFLEAYHLEWLQVFIAISLVLGGVGSVSNWIIAPTKGLLVAAQEGAMPKHFCKENRYGAPTALLTYQALFVSLLCSAFLMMPTVNGSYWLLTALAAQLYMLMYLLMFVAGMVLRFTRTVSESAFRIPGGKVGFTVVAVAGILGTITTVAIGFIPPASIDVGPVLYYEEMLVGGLFLMCLPPFLLARY